MGENEKKSCENCGFSDENDVAYWCGSKKLLCDDCFKEVLQADEKSINTLDLYNNEKGYLNPSSLLEFDSKFMMACLAHLCKKYSRLDLEEIRPYHPSYSLATWYINGLKNEYLAPPDLEGCERRLIVDVLKRMGIEVFN